MTPGVGSLKKTKTKTNNKIDKSLARFIKKKRRDSKSQMKEEK